MKTKFHCYHLIPVLAAGLMISPLAAQSPERPARGDSPREAPQPDRIQGAVRQIAELHQAGKHDEARAISDRLREAAKANPEVAKQVSEALRRQRPEAKPDARRPDAKPEARRPDAKPDAPRAEGPRPQAAEAPKRPDIRPPAPHQPQPQRPPVVRPNAAPQGPNTMPFRGQQMMPQGMPQGRQNGMRAPFQLQARPNLMQQRFSPQGRGAAMAMRMQFRKQLMQQPYLQHGQNSAMRQFMQMRGSAQPMMRPNAAAQPQCPQMRPNAAGQPQCPKMRPTAAGPKPQVIRPKVEAAKQAKAGSGEVAKIRHLRQAAVHLAGAGLAEHAAKAREEADRMTAALKAQPQATKAKPQAAKPKTDKPHESKPAPDRKPDVNAAILGELKKMGRQVEEMNARVRKLEAQEKAGR